MYGAGLQQTSPSPSIGSWFALALLARHPLCNTPGMLHQQSLEATAHKEHHSQAPAAVPWKNCAFWLQVLELTKLLTSKSRCQQQLG
jgi:hypothetical protein